MLMKDGEEKRSKKRQGRNCKIIHPISIPLIKFCGSNEVFSFSTQTTSAIETKRHYPMRAEALLDALNQAVPTITITYSSLQNS